jgi:hypothetical protein
MVKFRCMLIKRENSRESEERQGRTLTNVPELHGFEKERIIAQTTKSKIVELLGNRRP